MNWAKPGSGLRIGGHRGAAGEAPENTVAGFELAARAGVDYVELDVQLAADGCAMVFHDNDLDRTTDGRGPLAGRSSGDLLRLDAGSWFDPRFRDERIPTLDGFLAWLDRRPGLGATIEAKGPGSGAAIAGALATARARGDCSICSFSEAELRSAAAIDPTIPRMLIVDRDDPDTDLIRAAQAAAATAVNVPIAWLTVADVRRLHDAGLLVAGGTVDDATGIGRCLELAVDAVDSNQPSTTVAARDRLARIDAPRER
ncbi:MAG TPA: glycerophosphodiester phosphodiesterase family protein [Candidatus Deferrimicrobium sp.]|nr:glycerophosphodiester phosphodiesterase family protein [Candidatus Deferrimicrobium sp.]